MVSEEIGRSKNSPLEVVVEELKRAGIKGAALLADFGSVDEFQEARVVDRLVFHETTRYNQVEVGLKEEDGAVGYGADEDAGRALHPLGPEQTILSIDCSMMTVFAPTPPTHPLPRLPLLALSSYDLAPSFGLSFTGISTVGITVSSLLICTLCLGTGYRPAWRDCFRSMAPA